MKSLRVRDTYTLSLGKGESCLIRFLFGLLRMDGCVDLMLTDVSSRKGSVYVQREVSIKVNEGHKLTPIDCRKIAQLSIEFILGSKNSANFLITFSYRYHGAKNRRISLISDQYLLLLKYYDGFTRFRLVPWRGLFRTPPKAVLRMLLWESGFLK